MRTHARLLVAGGATLALAAWFLIGANRGGAADESTAREDILQLADSIKNSDAGKEKELTAKLKDADLELDIMPLFSLRKASGKGKALGLGEKPGAILPDGIEKKLEDLVKTPESKTKIAKEAPALEQAGYVAAAIAEIIPDKCPDEKKTKDPGEKDWKVLAQDMAQASRDFAAAAATQDPAKVQTAASKLDAACKKCHNGFKD